MMLEQNRKSTQTGGRSATVSSDDLIPTLVCPVSFVYCCSTASVCVCVRACVSVCVCVPVNLPCWPPPAGPDRWWSGG